MAVEQVWHLFCAVFLEHLAVEQLVVEHVCGCVEGSIRFDFDWCIELENLACWHLCTLCFGLLPMHLAVR